ncbi:SRPBCC family protein [Promicromonospora sp. NPDC050880]|uniref:SRPBCC family protein n=1 Tax=Promicromonospora sp. NPDC050880 TaxID=3364406 RepID=UPI0037A1BB32
MPTVTLSAQATVDAPAAEVWAVLADCTHDPRWRGGVMEMRQSNRGTVVEGVLTYETMRAMGSTLRTVTTVTAVTEAESGRMFRWVAVEGLDVEGSRRLTTGASGRSVVCLTLRYSSHGFGQWLLFPLMSRVLGRTLERDARRFQELFAADVPLAGRS